MLGLACGSRVRDQPAPDAFGDAALVKAAESDPKSFVRREALKALKKFPHDDTRRTLREVIKSDQSYYAVAEALGRSTLNTESFSCSTSLRVLPKNANSHVPYGRQPVLYGTIPDLVTGSKKREP